MSIFGRSNMSSEIGGNNIHRMLVIQVCHNSKLFQLRIKIQTIAALPLYSRYSHIKHFIQTFITGLPQLLKITRTGSTDSSENIFAIFYRRQRMILFQTFGKYFLPITSEKKMCMTIYKTRKQSPSGRIDFQIIVCIDCTQNIISRSYVCDYTA